jgi:hypothetical protein
MYPNSVPPQQTVSIDVRDVDWLQVGDLKKLDFSRPLNTCPLPSSLISNNPLREGGDLRQALEARSLCAIFNRKRFRYRDRRLPQRNLRTAHAGITRAQEESWKCRRRVMDAPFCC